MTADIAGVAADATPAALMLAGDAFERSRKAGATAEDAMRDALRVLGAAASAKAIRRRDGTVHPGGFALAAVARIAGHHKTTPELVRSRYGKAAGRAAREEAAGVLRLVGLTPDQIGTVLRCDCYQAIDLVRRLDVRVRADDLLSQRVEQWAAEAREMAAREASMRRPPQRANAASTVEVPAGKGAV